MIWITKKNNSLLELANAWLISKFVDFEADIKFCADQDIDQELSKTLGIPFGIEGVEFSDGVSQTTFEKLLISYRFDNPALILMSKVLKKLKSHPDQDTLEEFEIQGWDLSNIHQPTSLENAQKPLDALYHQCKHLTFPNLTEDKLH